MQEKVMMPSYLVAGAFIKAWAQATGDTNWTVKMNEIESSLKAGIIVGYDNIVDEASDRLLEHIESFMYYRTMKDLPQDTEGLNSDQMYEYEAIKLMGNLMTLYHLLDSVKTNHFRMDSSPSVEMIMASRVQEHANHYKKIIAEYGKDPFIISKQ